MQVRRLTPVECERLQGFPELQDCVTISVCYENPKNPALAAHLNHKSPNAASPAGSSASLKCASSVMPYSQEKNPRSTKPVVVNVEIYCEAGTMRLHIPESGWSEYAIIAEQRSSTFLQTPHGDFAQKIVAMLTLSEKTHPLGKEESPTNTRPFLVLKNGLRRVDLYGGEIAEYVEGAEQSILNTINLTKYTTSGVGSNSLSCDSNKIILSCFVALAINSCIPRGMLIGSSYEIRITRSRPYTNIPKASNSARYKALGNSWAVPVVTWVGWRIWAELNT